MKKYYLHDGTTQHGPFDMAELENKIITPQSLVWFDPLPDWKPAGEIEELRDLLNKKVPASRVAVPPQVQSKQEDWTTKQYYYSDGQGQHGPLTWQQLRNRPVQPDTPVWYDPLPEWTTAGKIPGLVPILSGGQQPEPIQPQVAPERQYYFLDGAHQKNGPFTVDQLKGKGLNARTLVWHEPLTTWTEAGKLTELQGVLAAPVPAIATGGKKIYYLDGGGKQQGPFDLEVLKSRNLQADTMIWYEGLPNWIKAANEPLLKDLVGRPAGDWSKKMFYYTDASGQQGPFTLEQMKTKALTAATPVWYDPLPNWTTAGQVEVLQPLVR